MDKDKKYKGRYANESSEPHVVRDVMGPSWVHRWWGEPPQRVYATPEDYAVCRELHKKFGTTYYFASRRFPTEMRDRVDALYGFVRVPDEWVDNPDAAEDVIAHRLRDYREQMRASLAGECPKHPALRAFGDLLVQGVVPIEEAELFLDAMEMDLEQTRYATYADLEGYMRGSAAAVGVMMARICGADDSDEVRDAAVALGNAMQMTNFLRDVGEDWQRGRLYLPLEDMGRFGVSLDDIERGTVTEAFVDLMQFEIMRTRLLYAEAERGIPLLPSATRSAVAIAAELYGAILDKIEENGYDVFTKRARTTTKEKLRAAARLALS